jgi:hypothetical protein
MNLTDEWAWGRSTGSLASRTGIPTLSDAAATMGSNVTVG